MASIPNVTTPVVINATTSLLVQSDFFLRRVCFVSFGDSTAKIGELVEVEASTYRDILSRSSSELALKLEQFFAYAGNKKGYVYECGAQPVTPLVDSFDVLKQFAYSKDETYEDKWYSSVYQTNFTDDYTKLREWSKTTMNVQDGNYARMTGQTIVAKAKDEPQPLFFETSMPNLTAKVYTKKDSTKTEVKDLLEFDFAAKTWTSKAEESSKTDFPLYVEFFDGASPLNSDKLAVISWSKASAQASPEWTYAGTTQGYQTWTIQNSKTPDLDSLKEYLSIDRNDWQADRGQYLAESDDAFKQLLTKDSLMKALEANSQTFGQMPDSYNDYLETEGNKSSDYSEKIDRIQAQINDGRQRMYIYALPKELYKYEGTGKLCQAYARTDSALYFTIEVDKTEVLQNSTSFQQFKGLKSVLAIYDNGSKGYSLTGAVLGRFVSAIFDITESNPATSLNYKAINGFNFELLNQTKEAELVENSVTFSGELVGNTVIFNGRTQDSRPFDYWYQWDISAFNLQEAVVAILLQGVNNPNQIIKYDQNGIDTVGATIKSRLTKMVNYGCITEFCVGLDPATGKSIESGYIRAIAFADYISANPDKYAMEIYDGFSFYIRIGKYLRQVILNITLG